MLRVEPKLLLTEGATVGWEGGEVGRNGQGWEGIGREGGTSRCGAEMEAGEMEMTGWEGGALWGRMTDRERVGKGR